MDPSDYLTMTEASAAIGSDGRRAIYRAVERAEAAGEGEMTVTIFGRKLVPKKNLDTLRRYYFPYYSEAHQAMVKVWGAKGGAASGVTKRRRKRQAEREAKE